MKYEEDTQKELDYTSGQSFERFAARLEAAKSTLDSALLAEIFSELMQSKGSKISIYDKLNKQQQDLLDNNHRTRDLLVDFRASEEAQAYEKLLLGLKYEHLNSRKTSILHQHKSTFEWIFPDKKSESSPGVANSGDNTDGAVSSSSMSTGSTISSQKVRDDGLVRWLQKDRDCLDCHEHDIQQKVKDAGFVKWLQEDSRCLYWVNGKPGSGKSTLMKFIENDERTKKALQVWQPKCNIISHFLWKPGAENQRSLKGMLCSLFYQVLNGIADWDVEDLKRLLFEVFPCSSSAYFVLLDGLDELSQSDGGPSKLFPLLERLNAMEQIKLCVSSRPERLFSDKFESFPSLRMQDLTQGDIYKYRTDFLEELQLRPHDELHQKISDKVTWKAEGVFIWVYVVLQSVKHGIKQYNEAWDDIYDRITKLLPDLMKLYKDMWSRLSEKNEKYIKKAARYFEFIGSSFNGERNVAMLALIADDNVLDVFIRPNEFAYVENLAKMCKDTAKTLMPVSGGLLEVDPGYFPSHEYCESASEDERKILLWVRKDVQFIHRTAKDFLGSDEGINLFEKYGLGYDASLSLYVKAQLALCSVTRYERHPLFNIWHTFMLQSYSPGLPQSVHRTLSLIHQCAANEPRGLVRPPYLISHENFFLFEASHYGFYEYVAEFLESGGGYNLTASIYVLIGACDLHHVVEDRSSSCTRYLAIKDVLQRHCQLAPKGPMASGIWSASEGIMLAWRCFLLHEVSGNFKHQFVGVDGKIVEDILEMFIKCGVILMSPRSKYLIAVQCSKLRTVKSASVQGTDLGLGYECSRCPHLNLVDPTIYIEVNDEFLLAELSKKISGASELVLAEAKNSSMRPILADDGTNFGDRPGAHTATFFHIKVPEDDQELFKDWIFKTDLKFEQKIFPDEQPSFLQAVDLGGFEKALQALEKIGYDLPEVNKGYDCLHTWL
ncbi:uncharacterized protein N7483_010522 [Penicillium malachiteum]|uniref:uncharacterized protein n=1 Tax=Penicillium malachiteum TaxID=1324776 RepID=UPI00254729E3|nr:uncharacterized protein N7483_010522 [Penicillium malachiteum]KAJ5713341.1 hypothetical protein N7483_010522 [Penicillium malachiteum]